MADNPISDASGPAPAGRPTLFHDLSAYVAVPQVTGLALSPDGARLVASVASLDAAGTARVPALYELDPAGERGARRLTRSAKGESAPAFAPDETLLFVSGRENTDPGAARDGEEREGPSLWALPERGEAERLVEHPGGVGSFAVAREAGTVAVAAALLPGATDAGQDAELRKARKDAKVTAILYESGPTRFWDADLGPDEPHVLVRRPDGTLLDAGGQGPGEGGGAALSPDGSLVAYSRFLPGRVPDDNHEALVVADASTGEERRVVEDVRYDYVAPVFTADGAAVVCGRMKRETYDTPYDETLVRVEVASGEETDLLPAFDNWPGPAVVSPSGDGTLFFTADEQGHCPLFRRDPDGTVVRLTASGAYSSVVAAPDGRTLYALRSAVDCPPAPVRLDAAAPDQEPAPLPAPGAVGPLPGTLTEVHATADDGHPLRAWLTLPEGASAGDPAPLLVVPHGGPAGSWNAWTWRWCPWPFTARGYAVLLPDPALSTGYGQEMHERGWGEWGGQPYRDVMALTDAAEAREDVDASRTGLAGASYGGYMANRVATLTERFRAIVSHAGLWDTRAFQLDTDAPWYFERVFGDRLRRPERHVADSPNEAAAKIRTPMLVTHGARDFRVPVGQGMGLFQDLQRFEVPAKFLYFPDENHWILSPRHAEVWFGTVLNFLDHHVLGAEWKRPPLL